MQEPLKAETETVLRWQRRLAGQRAREMGRVGCLEEAMACVELTSQS